MNLWLVLLLVGVVISPLSWLVPSRHQRGRSDIRVEARRLGLAMQLSRQEWPFWLEQPAPSMCAQYLRERRRGEVRTDWCFWQMRPGVWVDRWRDPCTDEQLAAQLAALPGDVYKAEAMASTVSVCWGERNGLEALQRVDAFLLAQA